MENMAHQIISCGGYGHQLEVIITEVTPYKHVMEVPDCVSSIIFGQLAEMNLFGEFDAQEYENPDNTISYKGIWRVKPKATETLSFNQLCRIGAWHYNYNEEEALTPKLFVQHYDKVMGDHYYSKWLSFKCDIMKMIGYFSDSPKEGQKFCNMIMQQVKRYETRILKYKQSKQIKSTMNSSDNNPNPFLQEGGVYTIYLKSNRVVKGVVYNHCVLSGNHYFSKDDVVYPVENVRSYSMSSHEISDDLPNSDLTISENEGDTIDVLLCPNKTPIVYARKKKELIECSGMTEDEAKEYLQQPIPLELFYDYDRGLFGVESEAVGETEIYNPYTGREIPKEN